MNTGNPHTEFLRCTCQHCGASLEIPPQYAGTTAPCPGCGEAITAPSAVVNQIPSKAELDRMAKQSHFDERINNPHIGVQEHSEEQYRNIENAPSVTMRPRSVRNRSAMPAAPVAHQNPPYAVDPTMLGGHAEGQSYAASVAPQQAPAPYGGAAMSPPPQNMAYGQAQEQSAASRRQGRSSTKSAIMPTAGLSSDYENKKDGNAIIKIFAAAILALIIVAAIVAAMVQQS